MAWIKFEKDLLTDPRVLRIARSLQSRWSLSEETVSVPGYALGNDVALPGVTLVCGALIRIWSLGDTHLDCDDTLPMGSVEIDELVGINGFCDLMPKDWLVEVDENTVKLPGFHEHNGTEAKKKALTQSRVERFRKRNANALQPRNARPLPDLDLEKTKTKKQKSAPQAAFALPDWIPSEPWSAWIEVRTKLRAPNTPRALALAVKSLDELRTAGHDPVAVLELATTRGWRGLFAPKVERHGNGGNGSGVAWWATEFGTKEHGKELGIEPRIGESMDAYRDRLRSQR